MPAQRAVLVDGARTPFVRAFGQLYKVDSIGLGAAAVGGLLKKTKLDPEHIDAIVWGNVVLQSSAPNIAREIVIDLDLPRKIVAHSTSMACSSGLKAIIEACTLVEGGHADVIIAGGSDSTSCAEVPMPRSVTHGLAMSWQYPPKSWGTLQRVRNFGQIASWSPSKWVPKTPEVAERSTGKTMGYHADLIAEMYGVGRADQEAFALRSHRNATEARRKGYLSEEIVPCHMDGKAVTADNIIQGDLAVMEKKMPSMKTAFRKKETGGTVTAASSSSLTDGGSCVLVMSEAKALELGYPIDCHLASWHFAAIDPDPQLLMAPALAIPRALDKAGLGVSDISFWEIHEAFSAQVLSTLAALESEEFCQKWMKRPRLDKVPRDRINVNGSSIAIGHPFAATGGRLVAAAVNELRRGGGRHALLSICAAGGLSSVAVVSRDPAKAGGAPSRPGAAPSGVLPDSKL